MDEQQQDEQVEVADVEALPEIKCSGGLMLPAIGLKFGDG